MTSGSAGQSRGQGAYDRFRLLGLQSLERSFPRVLPFYPGRFDLSPFLEGCSSVLDIGCGPQSLVSQCPGSCYSVGLDVFRGCLTEGSRNHTHTDFVQGDVRNLCFRPRSFDAVVALEVLEHLPKDQGSALLSAMETIASKAVLLTTPNGFVEQEELEGNPFQRHLSGWVPEEFRALGFEVVGLNGARGLRGPQGRLWLKPKLVAEWTSFLSQRFVQKRPSEAFQLLCVKRL